MGNLANLRFLSLSGNQLTGSIPPELGSISNLEDLWLFDNQLTGSIPKELGNLANLEYMVLSNNQLAGDMPEELGNLTNLIYLAIDENQLTGCVPAALRGVEYYGDNPFCTMCGAAVTDKSNTGLLVDCDALLAARDVLAPLLADGAPMAQLVGGYPDS